MVQTEDPRPVTPQNPTLFQSFEWHTPDAHYERLSGALATLSDIGVTSIWLPPGCKANYLQSNGYDCYDLWDLGEFDQKGTRSTKWGTREELNDLLAKAKDLGLSMIWDAVLNHKTAGDATEECWGVEVDPDDRTKETSAPRKIEPWIDYNFPGRGDKYSDFKWHWRHFNGTDWDQRSQKNAIFKIVDPPETRPRPGAPVTGPEHRKGWAVDVDDDQGNADYLIFSNIDYTDSEVRRDVINWGQWMMWDIGIDGFRLDAVQHYSWRFAKEWIGTVKAAGERLNRSVFVVGEFWVGDVRKLVQWVDRMGQDVYAYDAPLIGRLSQISTGKVSKTIFGFRLPFREVDLRRVFDDSLVKVRPQQAVTLVTNHDTQPGQAMDTPMAPYFKTLAYALILLRSEGLPCVFYGDLYGTKGPHAERPACGGRLPSLMLIRKLYAYGQQTDYFDSRTSIGWTRQGAWDRPHGCAVVLSIDVAAHKRMLVGREHAGEVWTDVLGSSHDKVTIDTVGYGRFACRGRNASVYVCRSAQGRELFPPAVELL